MCAERRLNHYVLRPGVAVPDAGVEVVIAVAGMHRHVAERQCGHGEAERRIEVIVMEAVVKTHVRPEGPVRLGTALEALRLGERR